MLKPRLTEKEADLVEALRNWRRSFPNGDPRLLAYAKELFDELAYPYDD